MFDGETGMCAHCQSRSKTVVHLATQCKQMHYHDYMRRHNEAVRCLHLWYCTKFWIKAFPRMHSHSVQELVSNENAEIRVDTWVSTGIKIQANKPVILIYDKMCREIILVEVGITSQDRLVNVEAEKEHRYDVLANKLGQEYKSKTRIIPYVITWDGVVTKHTNATYETSGFPSLSRRYPPR
ncbi:hypothetical protein PAPHI01_1686 [Pancytospora philotis]|nr:hypothetical protein PAPHI01_1686 [Pancytospora philotis]